MHAVDDHAGITVDAGGCMHAVDDHAGITVDAGVEAHPEQTHFLNSLVPGADTGGGLGGLEPPLSSPNYT